MTERSVTLSRLISVKGAKDCFCDSIIRVPCRASVCLSAHQSTVVRNLVIRKQVGEEDKLQASEENYSAFNRLCPPLLHSQLPSSRPPSLPPPPPVLPPLAFSPRRSPVSLSPPDIITIDDSPPVTPPATPDEEEVITLGSDTESRRSRSVSSSGESSPRSRGCSRSPTCSDCRGDLQFFDSPIAPSPSSPRSLYSPASPASSPSILSFRTPSPPSTPGSSVVSLERSPVPNQGLEDCGGSSDSS